MSDAPTSHLVRDQFGSAVVGAINAARLQSEILQQDLQDQAFLKAMAQIEKVREFVGTPEKILGNLLTKHGEIAEQVEVGVRNARAALAQQELPATFDGIGRTAATDYRIDGVDVQSKFINSVSKNLDHVLDHMDRYIEFGRDGAYHIPKDHHDAIERVLKGEPVEGLSRRTIDAIHAKVGEIEEKSGRSFNEVVKPSVSRYDEVQQGKIHETLEKHESELQTENQQRKDQVTQDHQPSIQEGLRATGAAAAVGGALSLCTALYAKYKEGKNPFRGDFTNDDWKELGLTTVKGTAGGAVAGGLIYGLTNYAGLSAPFAGAVVSAAKGVVSLTADLQAGKIDFDQFVSLGLIVCSESAVVGLATAAGQTLIPIPIVGAVIGSLAGKLLAEFATGKTEEVANRMRADMKTFLEKVDERYRAVVRLIEAEFEKLGKLTEAAFDLSLNTGLLERSVDLARAYGLDDAVIIKSTEELDDFMLS